MRHHASLSRGFTLIEVLVSMLILSVLAATAWKGMDSISSARRVADDNLKQTLRLQAVMTQWELDLAQVMDTQVVAGMQFDGSRLRMTRRSPAGVQVVVWALHDGMWTRWASPETTTVGELMTSWQRSFALQGNEQGTLVALRGVDQWHVYCFRSGTMSNCQSTGDVAKTTTTSTSSTVATSSREVLPSAVRSQLSMGEGSGLTGMLTRDVMLAPQLNQN
jgi:general secretion pathway protein J